MKHEEGPVHSRKNKMKEEEPVENISGCLFFSQSIKTKTFIISNYYIMLINIILKYPIIIFL